MTTPVFRALKKQYPSSYVAVMCVKRISGVFASNPDINKVLIFDEKTSQKSFLAKVKFISSLRAQRFDTVFLIHRSFTRALVCFLGAIPVRVGYRRVKNVLIVNRGIKSPSGVMHRQDYYLYLFRAAGINLSDKLPEIFIPDDISKDLARHLKPIHRNKSCIIGINPAANWALKRWSAGSFAELCDLLIKDLNAAVVFVGTAANSRLLDDMAMQMQHKAHNFCGRTNLKQLGALIAKCQLFISNDSGPAHLSAALGVKTLILFGPTAPAITAPRGQNVTIIQKDTDCPVPCYDLNCKDNICMKKITVAEVFTAAKRIIKND